MLYEEKLVKLGFDVAIVPVDTGRFLQATQTGNLVYTAGQVSTATDFTIRGKVGADVSLEQAREAARLCTVNCLRAIKSVVGSLDRIVRIVKVFGMVNVAPGFDQTPSVIDACSDLLVDIFGGAGRHARSAVGMTIPLNFAVEIEMIAEVRLDVETQMYNLP